MATRKSGSDAGISKERLEAALGTTIDAAPEQILRLWYPASAYSYTDKNMSGVQWRNLLLPFKNCVNSVLFDIHGTSSTDTSGRRVFRVSDATCLTLFAFDDPVNVLLTPRNDGPCYLTMEHRLVPIANTVNVDIEITVFSWNAAGKPAANQSFDWRCRCVSREIIV
jgi:hypothetical protein